MSIEICYAKQFVRLPNGGIVPLILSGSSNCTMFHNGREIYERHWWPIGLDDTLGKPLATILSWFSERADQERPDGEWFTIGSRSGRWITNASIMDWVKNAIDSAYTIDEIVRLRPHQSLRCSAHGYSRDIPYGEKGHDWEELVAYIRTGEELQKWIEQYATRVAYAKPNEAFSPEISFSGVESLGLGKKIAEGKPVVCKAQHGYLTEYSATSYTFEKNPEHALVFESADDFFAKITGPSFKFTLVSVPKKAPENKFVILSDRGYVLKQSSRRLFFTYSKENAKGFPTEASAQKYADALKDKGFKVTLSVVPKEEEKS